MEKETLTKREDLAAYFEKLEAFQAKLQGRFPFDILSSCLRCGYWWKRRKKGLPKRCPRCMSQYWQTTRKNRQGMRPEVA